MSSSHAVSDTIHTLPVQDVYAALTSRPDGLNSAEAGERLQQFGANAIREARKKPIIIKFASNFTHLMAILLWVGGIVGLIAELPQLAIAIWMVNVINGVFSFWQEFRAEKATEALRKLLPSYVRVIRDGQEQRLLVESLVPGDVILLAEGERISADARLVEQAELRVDQSTLTGESHAVRKINEAVLRTDLARAELSNLVFAGTSVAAGTGKAVVFATGMNTEFGKIAGLTQALEDELSPLQKEMVFVTRIVTFVAVGVGVVFFVLSMALAGINLAESIIFAMGMIVAFVPEGLLPTITLALALAVQRMVKRNALIKRLSAVEALGCTSVICTDKTGTLTQNEMTVTSLWLGGHQLAVKGVGYAPTGNIDYRTDAKNSVPTEVIQEDAHHLLRAASLCNNARLLKPESNGAGWSILGDPTEAALKVAALKGQLDLEAESNRHIRLRELPFDSRRKRMTTIHQSIPTPARLQSEAVGRRDEIYLVPTGNIPSLDAGSVLERGAGGEDQRVAFIKGAPKEVLALSTRIWVHGQECALDESWKTQITAANDAYARNGLRVLAVAMRQLPASEEHSVETVERDLTFLGLMAMMDPPRPEVSAAVQTCHQAGIRIIMITGDYGLTAESIARRIGIIRGDQPRIVTGTELDTLNTDALREALRGEVIFARVAPEHKLKVVSALQELGDVVAVTGDGVNDAPALKKADIGVAMGLNGTDVAREAADMILTDDNFASIVNAIEEGRAVYANIKKFITYIFTSNTPEAVPFILFAFSAGRIPLALNIMQILSIDLGTDMIPALALGAEPPEPGIMSRPPRNLHEHVITRGLLLRAYAWLGMIQSLAAMAAFYFMYWINGYWGQWIDLPSSGWLYEAATAMTLGAVVATQIGNLFAQRTETLSVFRLPLFQNRLLWVGIATELLLVALIVYVPFFQNVFGTAEFPLVNWLFLFAWTPSLFLADELRKWIVRRRKEN